MKKNLFYVFILIFSFITAKPALAGEENGPQKLQTMSLVTLVIGLAYLEGLQPWIGPTRPYWKNPGTLDTQARTSLLWKNREAAAVSSDIFNYILGASALWVPAFTGVAYQNGLFIMVEALLWNQIITRIAKMSFGRQRPYSYYSGGNSSTPESNSSFFSGHTSFAFTTATLCALLVQSRYKLWISIASYTAAAAVGYFRIAADRHYLTDVLVGALSGTLTAYLVYKRRRAWLLPEIHKDYAGLNIRHSF